MAFLTQLYTNSLSDQDIHATLLIGTFTNTTRIRKLYINVFCDQVAGGGDYKCSITWQRAGAGSAYQSIITTNTLAAGVTSALFNPIALIVDATAVIKIYLLGLAGDTVNPDTFVEVVEEFVNVDSSGNVTVATNNDKTGYALTTTPPTVGQIDTQLSGTHGAGDWGPSGTSGAYTVHVTVVDDDTAAVLTGALVTLKDSADTALIDQQRTRDDGVATRITESLDAATYTIHASLPGYQALVESHTIAANADITLSLIPIAVGAPSAPDLCRLYGYEYLNGAPVLGSIITASIANAPQTQTPAMLETDNVQAVSDSDGYWYLDLVQQKAYLISIDQAGLHRVIEMPDAASANLAGLI